MTHKNRLHRSAVILLTAAALMMALAVPAVGAGPFSDVSGDSWYAGAVDFVSREGLFQGTSASTFTPNGTMTRAMFITALGRYAGADAASWCVGSVSGSDVNLRSGPGTDHSVVTMLDFGTALTIRGKSGDWYQVSTGADNGYIRSDYVKVQYHVFSDVSFDSYYAGYAVWAYEKGIVEGVGSSSTFSPDSNITREQACTLLARFASAMGVSIPASGAGASFSDDGKISSWARDSVYALSRAGIVQGRANGVFDPTGCASRAEAAAILQRFDTSVGGFTAPPGQQGGIQSSTPSDSEQTAPPDQTPSEGEQTAPPDQAPPEDEQTTPPEGEQTTPPDQTPPESTGLLANAALVDRLDQGDRACCLATSFSMAANLILGRNEYGPYDWTAGDINDGLSVPAGTSFLGTDGRTYSPNWSAGGLTEDGLRAAIDSALASGLPIIASVQTATSGITHYVVVVGWTDSSHSDYLIADPAVGPAASIRDGALAMAGDRGCSLGNKDGTYVYISFS